jgi:hypothetical protein
MEPDTITIQAFIEAQLARVFDSSHFPVSSPGKVTSSVAPFVTCEQVEVSENRRLHAAFDILFEEALKRLKPSSGEGN